MRTVKHELTTQYIEKTLNINCTFETFSVQSFKLEHSTHLIIFYEVDPPPPQPGYAKLEGGKHSRERRITFSKWFMFQNLLYFY